MVRGKQGLGTLSCTRVIWFDFHWP
jgi:hypothetical protein